jgi:hypothetical protein
MSKYTYEFKLKVSIDEFLSYICFLYYIFHEAAFKLFSTFNFNSLLYI